LSFFILCNFVKVFTQVLIQGLLAAAVLEGKTVDMLKVENTKAISSSFLCSLYIFKAL
jgi:hypothetical protein